MDAGLETTRVTEFEYYLAIVHVRVFNYIL